ncbi:hypothetical protein ACFY19_14820 [Streptosporangium saharense]|uniref:Uncharacterized protein n=1 Tax=Streptosporangium saharense TaxID=1706840 RepID=A0A7W7QVB8_9ACTN|nr:hypothetical protein [Streptosporangium saharense]MBB4920437.1 hypothetical protein [Streptosporangium saharense]
MDPDTFRSDIGVDVYWRRRMAALVGVLMVVAAVAWACSASGQDDDHRANGTATGSPSPDPILALLPAVTITPTPSAPGSPEPSPAPKAAAKERPKVVVRRPGQTCDPSDLVLDMRGRSEVYAGGNRPQFIVTLVNTSEVMCTADVGARALEVRITSGDDRIWSSADCVSGEIQEIYRLDRGIPYVRQIEWDRHRSGGDCSAQRATAKAGTYVAVVRTPDLKSHKAVFHLR